MDRPVDPSIYVRMCAGLLDWADRHDVRRGDTGCSWASTGSIGVDPPEVAERAGNSVEVLLGRYTKCIDGRQEIATGRWKSS
jgi:hypothetical protein